jgi:hypothetical protein
MEPRKGPRILNNPALDRKLQKAICGLNDPVEIRLTSTLVLANGNVDREKLVLEYGRPFVGIARPKGYRQWARKQCFRNAGALANRGQCTYCEGFVLTPPRYSVCIHHAWITLDGKSAVDVTLPNAPECWYFGIPFSEPVFRHLFGLLSVEQGGVWPAYIDLPLDERVIAALKEMRTNGLL